MRSEPRHRGLEAVHGFVAAVDLQAGVAHDTVARVRRIADGEHATATSGRHALAWRGDLRSWSGDGQFCLLDGRLHDRAALRRRLGVDGGDDAQLLAMAVSRHGPSVLRDLRGTFAFFYWDEHRQQALVGQDHLGGRSLFLLRDGGRWLIGSELRLVVEAAARRPGPSADGLAQWMTDRTMRNGTTLFEGVRRLAGGQAVRVDRDGLTTDRYWEPRFDGVNPVSEAEAEALLMGALETAVRRRIEPQEHLGILLSGGIDSSTVAACAVRLCGDLEPDLTAFSIVMPDDPVQDETFYIDAITSDLGLPGARITPAGTGAMWNAWWFQDAFGVPLPTPGTVLDQPLVRMAAESGASAILDGQGGDEVLGAQPYLLADLLRRGRVLAAWRLIHSVPVFGGPRPGQGEVRHMLRTYGFRGNTPAWYDARRPDTTLVEAPPYLRPDVAQRYLRLADPFGWKRRDGPRWWAAHVDWLVDTRDVLGMEDLIRRRSRLEGIDARCALLDVDLVETVLRLPPAYAFHPLFDRALARRAMQGLLPDTVRLRARKSHFGRFNHDLVLPACEPALTSLLEDPTAEIRAYVSPSGLADLLRGRPGTTDAQYVGWGPAVWSLATTEMWLRAEAGRGDEVLSAVEKTFRPHWFEAALPWRPAPS